MESINGQTVESMRNIGKNESNMEKVIIAQHKVKWEEDNGKMKKELIDSLSISSKMNIDLVFLILLFQFIEIVWYSRLFRSLDELLFSES